MVLLLNKADAAKALGVSEKTLDSWIERFGLPRLKLERSVRFSVKALNHWVDTILPQIPGGTDESNT
ncbi:MAG: helix-turn-helix domain-containing protein [Pirellulales bacterium]